MCGTLVVRVRAPPPHTPNKAAPGHRVCPCFRRVPGRVWAQQRLSLAVCAGVRLTRPCKRAPNMSEPWALALTKEAGAQTQPHPFAPACKPHADAYARALPSRTATHTSLLRFSHHATPVGAPHPSRPPPPLRLQATSSSPHPRHCKSSLYLGPSRRSVRTTAGKSRAAHFTSFPRRAATRARPRAEGQNTSAFTFRFWFRPSRTVCSGGPREKSSILTHHEALRDPKKSCVFFV
jgi:hypothetical protein